jgi:hypothetical protein
MRWNAIFVATFLAGCAAAGTDASALPELAVPAVKEGASVDGVLDDEVWKSAVVIQDFRQTGGEAARTKTRALIARDAQGLYIAVEAFEEPQLLGRLKTRVRGHDEDEIWQDDSIELFIDPTGQRRTYYQMIINAAGVYWDGYHDGAGGADKTWQPQCQIVVKKGDDRWTAEIRLPWTAFTRTDDFAREWAFNLVRNSTPSGEAAYWSPVLGKSNLSPQRFGTLRGITVRR